MSRHTKSCVFWILIGGIGGARIASLGFWDPSKHGSSVRSARQRAARSASEVSLLRVERDSHDHGAVVSGVGVSHLRELQMHLDG
jgi:hypothetical protein